MSKQTQVSDLMISKVETFTADKTVLEAVKLMNEKNIGALIIVDLAGHTVGIFTERDLFKKVVVKELPLTTPLGDVMTKDLVCAQLHDDFETIPQMMVQGGFRHVPVVDVFFPVGILSIRDVLHYYVNKK